MAKTQNPTQTVNGVTWEYSGGKWQIQDKDNLSSSVALASKGVTWDDKRGRWIDSTGTALPAEFGKNMNPNDPKVMEMLPRSPSQILGQYNVAAGMLDLMTPAEKSVVAAFQSPGPKDNRMYNELERIQQKYTPQVAAKAQQIQQSGAALPTPKGLAVDQYNAPTGAPTTKESEIARAQQVWADADKLAGTGKYVGKTADQIRTDAHAYADSLRAGGPIGSTQAPGTAPVQSPVSTPDAGTPGDVSTPGAQTPPPGTAYDANGKLIFSTGNPQFDEFLNGEYAASWDAELNGQDPNTFFNSEAFKSIKARVDATWGPKFAQDLADAQSSFDLTKQGTEAQQKKSETDLTNQLTRGQEDTTLQTGRLNEDLGVQQQRIARNYNQAMDESKLAMAARKLTFSGDRQKAENVLGQNKALDLTAANTANQRSIQDLQTQQSRLGTDTQNAQDYNTGAYGRTLQGQQNAFDIQKREIAGQLPVKYAEERANIRTLGGSMLSNPQFMPTRSIT